MRAKRRTPYGHRTSLEPFGTSGGFTVTYPSGDASILKQVRQYQDTLRRAGWLSRIDYGDGEFRLHVFPVSDIPRAVFASPSRYGAQR